MTDPKAGLFGTLILQYFCLSFTAIFDGHGGREVADLAATEFPHVNRLLGMH